MIASVQELITQERSAGSTDDQIAALLRASRNIKPPEGHYRWSRVAVRAAMTEDPSGFLADGRPGSGTMR